MYLTGCDRWKAGYRSDTVVVVIVISDSVRLVGIAEDLDSSEWLVFTDRLVVDALTVASLSSLIYLASWLTESVSER